jgi:hypothetical protein
MGYRLGKISEQQLSGFIFLKNSASMKKLAIKSTYIYISYIDQFDDIISEP